MPESVVSAPYTGQSAFIFGTFTNMEELQTEVLKAANACYQRYLKEDMAAGRKALFQPHIQVSQHGTDCFNIQIQICCGGHGGDAFSKEKRTEKIAALSDSLGLNAVLARRAGKLSGGWQRRFYPRRLRRGEQKALPVLH